MTRFDRVLCPVDLSETSRQALAAARQIAAWYDGDLTVLEVSWAGLPPIAYPAAVTGTVPPVLDEEMKRALGDELHAFAGPPPANARERLVVREGAIVPQVLEEAQAMNANLIVIGTHGRSGFDRLLLGSVAERLLRKSPAPVLTVPPGASVKASFRTIACAIDFSPASIQALDVALSLAQEAAGQLLLVHVTDWPEPGPATTRLGASLDGLLADWQYDAARQLEALVPASARDWCQVETVVPRGRAHEAIVDLARTRGVDLLVMGVHARNAADLAFFGSTANHVVREAPCAVLTVRPAP